MLARCRLHCGRGDDAFEGGTLGAGICAVVGTLPDHAEGGFSGSLDRGRLLEDEVPVSQQRGFPVQCVWIANEDALESGLVAIACIPTRFAQDPVKGKLAALATTTAAWDQAFSFSTNMFLDHPRVFEARTTREVRSGPDAGNTREVVDLGRIGDGTNGSAPWRRSLLAVPATCDVLPLLQHPVPYRRTGGTFGVGRKKPPTQGRKPKPQRHPHRTAYGGMAQVHLGDDRDGFIRLKVKTGVGWDWLHYPVQVPPCLDAMLPESVERRDRIGILRAEKQRMAAEGRKERTAQEHKALRPTPGRWVAESPTVIRKRDGWC